jgi:hypothetical protein
MLDIRWVQQWGMLRGYGGLSADSQSAVCVLARPVVTQEAWSTLALGAGATQVKHGAVKTTHVCLLPPPLL